MSPNALALDPHTCLLPNYGRLLATGCGMFHLTLLWSLQIAWTRELSASFSFGSWSDLAKEIMCLPIKLQEGRRLREAVAGRHAQFIEAHAQSTMVPLLNNLLIGEII